MADAKAYLPFDAVDGCEQRSFYLAAECALQGLPVEQLVAQGEIPAYDLWHQRINKEDFVAWSHHVALAVNVAGSLVVLDPSPDPLRDGATGEPTRGELRMRGLSLVEWLKPRMTAQPHLGAYAGKVSGLFRKRADIHYTGLLGRSGQEPWEDVVPEGEEITESGWPAAAARLEAATSRAWALTEQDAACAAPEGPRFLKSELQDACGKLQLVWEGVVADQDEILERLLGMADATPEEGFEALRESVEQLESPEAAELARLEQRLETLQVVVRVWRGDASSEPNPTVERALTEMQNSQLQLQALKVKLVEQLAPEMKQARDLAEKLSPQFEREQKQAEQAAQRLEQRARWLYDQLRQRGFVAEDVADSAAGSFVCETAD